MIFSPQDTQTHFQYDGRLLLVKLLQFHIYIILDSYLMKPRAISPSVCVGHLIFLSYDFTLQIYIYFYWFSLYFYRYVLLVNVPFINCYISTWHTYKFPNLVLKDNPLRKPSFREYKFPSISLTGASSVQINNMDSRLLADMSGLENILHRTAYGISSRCSKKDSLFNVFANIFLMKT